MSEEFCLNPVKLSKRLRGCTSSIIYIWCIGCHVVMTLELLSPWDSSYV